MRNIINLSIPEDMNNYIKQEIKENNYTSVSEFFRKLVRDYKEEKLLKELKKDQEEFRKNPNYCHLSPLKSIIFFRPFL